MEINRIEFAERRKFCPGVDNEPPRLVIGGFASPQRLQVPVDGHQRHSEHFAELRLCERQRTRIAVGEAGDFCSVELLAKEMREPTRSVSAAVVGDAFAENRRVD